AAGARFAGCGAAWLRGVVALDGPVAAPPNAVLGGGGGGDEVGRELALQPLLDDLQVQQSEEAAPEPEAEGSRVLGLERESAVVQLQLLERLLQVSELVGVGGEQSREDHRLHAAIAR